MEVVNISTTSEDSADDGVSMTWVEVAVSLMGTYLLPGTSALGIVFNSLTVAVVLYMGINNATLVYMTLLALGDSLSIFIDALLNIG